MSAAVWTLRLSKSLERPRDAPAEAADNRDRPHANAEWDLVRRAQEYDEAALEALYQTYYPKIYNYAFLQMGDVHASEATRYRVIRSSPRSSSCPPWSISWTS